MQRKVVSCIVLSFLLLSLALPAFAAELWAPTVTTELWSMPKENDPPKEEPIEEPQVELTEEPEVTQPKTTVPLTEQWAPTPIAPIAEPVIPAPLTPQAPKNLKTVILIMNSFDATIDGQSKKLDVAPMSIDGRTMVPLRFISDALGATIKWDETEQKITLNIDGSEINLWIGRSQAMVNKKAVQMDVPAQVIDGRTLVPVRFISESLNRQVKYDGVKQSITITGSGNNSPTPSNSPSDNNSNNNTYTGIIGKWSLRTPGGISYTQNYLGDTYQHYTPGADAGVLIVNKDGTYSMNAGIHGKASGKWRTANEREISNIILQAGPGGKDWAVRLNTDGKISTGEDSGAKLTSGLKIWISVQKEVDLN